MTFVLIAFAGLTFGLACHVDDPVAGALAAFIILSIAGMRLLLVSISGDIKAIGQGITTGSCQSPSPPRS